MAKSKIQILEALLRLRQAACHGALLDESRAKESSSKFDLLVPQLAEIVAEGHKALVFSQFTSLLALLNGGAGFVSFVTVVRRRREEVCQLGGRLSLGAG